jgi:hypothetical protein
MTSQCTPVPWSLLHAQPRMFRVFSREGSDFSVEQFADLAIVQGGQGFECMDPYDPYRHSALCLLGAWWRLFN